MGRHPAPDRGAALAEARSDWQVWGVAASLVIDDPAALTAARRIADAELTAATAVCSRFEPDSELSRVNRGPRPAEGIAVSPLFAEYLETALAVAADTDGAVDPTLGADLEAIGYDRDFAELPVPDGIAGVSLSLRRPRRAGWRRTRLEDGRLHLPPGLRLDLGASAKAHAADRIAHLVADATGASVLVSLGGDLATAGPARRRWEVLVQDRAEDPSQQVSIPNGSAIATSSTGKRRWRTAEGTAHHILDPRYGLPVDARWRSVSVAARRCVTANALSTAAIVRGPAAVGWLTSRGADARLVALDGGIVRTGAWPVEARDG
ncbi:FAD:protein FMN transferase [Leifsonia aquatica]|uniref:FAD:protein FMN transferase n=1 Tax=Leifsonia aquatica TaxID=144185 RepID=UPI00046AE363|nr:FAD:protein FMN transferase [Leifsonia aquatica]